MDKKLIIKVIRGEASAEEVDLVYKWANRSPDNKRLYANIHNIYVASIINEPENALNELGKQSQSTKKNVGSGVRVRIRPFFKYSVAAAIFIALIVDIIVKVNENSHTQDKSQISELGISSPRLDDSLLTVYTDYGTKGHLTLPDGSDVWLNSGSKIMYPVKFKGKTRDVTIIGEALFSVKKDSLFPMVVKTINGADIVVRGTRFAIKCYDQKDDLEATLYSGKIEIESKGANIISLEPNQSVKIGADMSASLIRMEEPTRKIAWTKGRLVFDNRPMGDVFEELERWYGTTFIIKDSSVLSYSLTAEFVNESIIQVMDIVNYVTNTNYTIEGKTVTILK